MASRYEKKKKKRGRIVREELEGLARENLYRELREVKVLGSKARISSGKEALILLCSNDYLGLSRNVQVLKRTINSLRRDGFLSQSSSRLVSGNDPALVELESRLAEQKRLRRALVFPTGYMANLGVISGLAGRDDLVLSDELNHASIVDGCRLSRAEVRVFSHNDSGDLEAKLSAAAAGYRRKIVVTEGVFSMGGDLAALDRIGKIVRRNDALLVVDDAHGDFVYGANYRGTAEHLHAERYVDLLVSSMSKALGCFGGYVAGRDGGMIEYLINKSRPFIYTSALPAAIASGAVAALKAVGSGTLQRRLWRNVARFRKRLDSLGFDLRSQSHIIPVIVGDEKLALKFSNRLLWDRVFVQAIRYPTVPRGSARLRISITSSLKDGDIDEAVDAFRRSGTKLGII